MKNNSWKALIYSSAVILLAGSYTAKSISSKNSTQNMPAIYAEDTTNKTNPTDEIINEYLKNVTEPTIKPEMNNTTPNTIEKYVKEEEPVIQKKTNEQIAYEVISGLWGDGEERQNKLVEAEYNYDEICEIVNSILSGKNVEVELNHTYSGNFAYINQDTNMYDENNNVIYNIDQFQKAVVVNNDESNSRKHVIITGLGDVGDNITMEGYIDSGCLTTLPDTFIETDISMQKVFLYDNGELVLETNVITGGPDKGATPGTNVGCTKVLLKEYDTELSGPTWSGAYVDVYIKFNWSGEGYHDSERWRTTEELNNINTFLTNGSHGCVNMSNDAAKKVDDVINVGDTSLVHK